MSENGEIYTAGKNFTLLPAVTVWTNSTSDGHPGVLLCKTLFFFYIKVLQIIRARVYTPQPGSA